MKRSKSPKSLVKVRVWGPTLDIVVNKISGIGQEAHFKQIP